MSMKKKNFWSAVLAMGLAATLSVGFVGCSDDDEPTPEIVTDNPLDKEVYYIAGKVTEGGKSLEGVEVSTSGKSVKTAADGTYQLAMDKIGTYVVTFAKDGYVTVTADAMIPSGTPKHGSVALSQTLTSLAASVIACTISMLLMLKAPIAYPPSYAFFNNSFDETNGIISNSFQG